MNTENFGAWKVKPTRCGDCPEGEGIVYLNNLVQIVKCTRSGKSKSAGTFCDENN